MAQQCRALRTREALIESAARTFVEQGYARASLSVISARAGVSNGALHHHFSSKAALARAVGQAAERRLARITAGHEPRSPGESSLQCLIDATHEVVRELGHDIVLRAGFDATRALARSGVPAGPGRLWTHWVGRTLDGLRRAGALRQEAPADAAALTLVAATLGVGVLADGAPARRTETLTRLWVLLLPALVPAGSAAALVPSGTSASAHRGPCLR